MNIRDLDHARELVTHRLSGELGDDERRALEAFIAANPGFQEEVRTMEQVWGKLGLLKGTQAAPPMSSALKRRVAPLRLRNVARGAAAAAAVILIGWLGIVAFGGRGTGEGGADRAGGLPTDAPPVVAGSDVEVPVAHRLARLARARGLVVVRTDKDERWHLLRRGEEVPDGARVRVACNPDFGGILLDNDGSTITLRAGAEVRREAERAWRVERGAAHFAVARNDAPFTVKTPQGEVRAVGTEFTVTVTAADEARAVAASTLCDVSEGAVTFAAGEAAAVEIVAGRSGLADAGGARLVEAVPGSRDWLAAIQARNEADETVARLVAEVGEAGKRLPLEIVSYSVDVTVVDGVARTFLDMVFHNHTAQRLEGTFYYSLPADASISEFAMYVGDQRIVGEVLEQQRARQIFEYIRREQRDPALLEWAGGNLFKMRVYPIEPNSDKRVQLGYTQVLRRREGQVTYTFPLVSEMLQKNPLRSLAMQVKVLSTQTLSDLACPTHRARIGVSEDKTRGLVAFAAKDYTPERDFKVTWRVPDDAECIVLTNRRPDDPVGYFMAQIDPRVPAAARAAPQRLIVVVDGSASIGPEAYSIAREFAVAAGEMVSGWNYDVILAAPGYPADTSGDPSAVRAFLDRRVPLGGTDLLKTFAAVAAKLPAGEAVRVIYVGDGVDALGEHEGAKLVDEIAKLFFDRPVEISCVAVGSSYDQQVLASLAAKTGGTFHAIQAPTGVFEAADAILDELSRPVLRDVTLSFENIAVAALYPPVLGTLAVGDTGLVLGRVVKGGEGVAVVAGTADGNEFRREYMVNMSLPEAQNQFLPRLWAKAHMDALRAQMGMGDAAFDKYLVDQIIAVSIDYQIMSPYTAFLVLESEEDYKKFGIVRQRRMVDWRGELSGVTHRVEGATVPAPVVRRITRGEAIPLLIAEPDLMAGLAPAAAYAPRRTASVNALGGRAADPAGQPFWLGLRLASEEEAMPLLSDRFKDSPVKAGLESEARAEKNESLRLGEEFLGRHAEWAFEGEEGKKERAEIGRGDRMSGWSDEDLSVRFEDRFVSDLRLLEAPMRRSREMDGPMPAMAPAPSRPDSGRRFAADALFSRSDIRSRERIGYYAAQRYTGYLDGHGIAEVATDDGGKLTVSRTALDPIYARRAVVVKPQDAQVRLDLALVLLRAGRFREALAELDTVMKSASRDPHLWFERAWLQQRIGQDDDAYASLKKARDLGLAVEGQADSFRTRYAEQLAQHRRWAEASQEFLALAEAAEQENPSVSLYTQAYSYAQSAGQADGADILDRMLARWPESSAANQTAANHLWSTQPERALALAEKAQALGADMRDLRIRILFELNRSDEALALLQRAFAAPKDASDAQRILNLAYERDPARATAWAEKALAEAKRPQLDGALTFIQNQGLSEMLHARLIERGLKPDFPADLRIQLFYALHNHGGRNPEWAKVLLPLLDLPAAVDGVDEGMDEVDKAAAQAAAAERTKTRSQAVQAVQTLANYQYFSLVAPQLDRLSALKDLTDNERHSLLLARWQVDWNTGDKAKAVESLEKAFRATENADFAYMYANHLLTPLVQQAEYERAMTLVSEMVRRFPDHGNNATLVQNLWRTLSNSGQADLVKKLSETLRALEPAGPQQELTKRYAEVIETVRAKDYPKADAALRELTLEIETRLKDLEPRLKALEEKVKAAEEALQKQRNATGQDKEALEAAAVNVNLVRSDYGKLAAEFNVVNDLLRACRLLRPRVAAMGDDLRAAFLAECAEKAKGEDPVAREWTHAALECLRYAPDGAAYRDRLERLRADEPNDPFWPRLLFNAYLLGGETEKALALADALLAESPDDVQLAVARHALAELTGDAARIEDAERAMFAALSGDMQTLQQAANMWQQQKRGDLAVKAWLTLQQTPDQRSNPWPTQRAAQVIADMGDTLRAAELSLSILANPEWANAGHDAAQRLRQMMSDENVLRLVEQRLPALLEAAGAAQPPSAVTAYALMLAHRAAALRNRLEEAEAHVKALMALPLKDAPNAASQVLRLLADENRWDDVLAYARTGGGDLPQQTRTNLMREAGDRTQNVKEQADAVAALWRDAIERDPRNANDLRYRLVNHLVQHDRLADAEAETAKMTPTRNPWQYWNAMERVISGYQSRQDFAKAARIALDAWKDQRQSARQYGDNMWYRFSEACWRALEKNQLPDDLAALARNEIKDDARAWLGGTSGRSVFNGYWNQLWQRLGIEGDLLALADTAGQSGDPQRMLRAAELYRNLATYQRFDRGRMDTAAAIYRRVIALETAGTNERSQALGALYSILMGYAPQDYATALDTLEAWNETSRMDASSYQYERARCLYALNRRDEARESVRKVLDMQKQGRDPWRLENTANVCRGAKDYEMEILCRERALVALRLQRNVQPDQVARFYAALGGAHAEAGDLTKAVDACLRGMSLIDRHQQRWPYQHLRETVVKIISEKVPGGLDAVVAHYEKTMAPDGEMPHLRIAFGEAYRQARQEEKALAQFAVAADLLPKDVTLRKEVVDGYVRLRKYAEAEKACLSWAKLDPQNIEVFRTLGGLYETMQKPDLAMAAYASMAQARPREAEGHRAYAQVLVNKNLRSEAVVAFVKARRYRPTEFDIASELVGVLRALQREGEVAAVWKDGEAACRRAMNDLPDDPLPWLNLARFLKAQERTAEARELLGEVLRRPWPRFASETRSEAGSILKTL